MLAVNIRAVFLASQAALARIREGSYPVAERFELYVDGIELANGYHELLDAGILRARNAKANAQRIADGKKPLREDSRLLTAMDRGLPACVGVALGFAGAFTSGSVAIVAARFEATAIAVAAVWSGVSFVLIALHYSKR